MFLTILLGVEFAVLLGLQTWDKTMNPSKTLSSRAYTWYVSGCVVFAVIIPTTMVLFIRQMLKVG